MFCFICILLASNRRHLLTQITTTSHRVSNTMQLKEWCKYPSLAFSLPHSPPSTSSCLHFRKSRQSQICLEQCHKYALEARSTSIIAISEINHLTPFVDSRALTPLPHPACEAKPDSPTGPVPFARHKPRSPPHLHHVPRSLVGATPKLSHTCPHPPPFLALPHQDVYYLPRTPSTSAAVPSFTPLRRHRL